MDKMWSKLKKIGRAYGYQEKHKSPTKGTGKYIREMRITEREDVDGRREERSGGV
jgi:hypothetical protein